MYRLLPSFGNELLGKTIVRPKDIGFPEAVYESGIALKLNPTPSKIALIGPVDPLKSGIAWNTTRLWLRLKEMTELDLYQTPVVQSKLNREEGIFPFFLFKSIQMHKSYEKVILVVGNGNHYHESINGLYNESNCEIVVILHDVVITGIDWKFDPKTPPILAKHGLHVLPLGTTKVLVHSNFAATMVRESLSTLPRKILVSTIKTGVPVEFVLPESRNKPSDHVIGTAGFFDHSKSPMTVLETFALLAKKFENASFEWVGEIDSFTVKSMYAYWEKLGLSAVQLSFLGYQDEAKFRETLQGWSCGIQLRSRTNGESSGVVFDLAACGTPVVVSNVGSFTELSDELFYKVKPLAKAPDVFDQVSKVLSLRSNDWSDLSDLLREEAKSHSFSLYAQEVLSLVNE